MATSCLFLSLCAGTCRAESDSVQPLDRMDATPVAVMVNPPIEITIIASKLYDNSVGTSDAASQGTVSGAQVQDLPLLRPGEVLEAVPGMVVTQHSGDGKANQYFLRGYNLDHGTDFATFVDGVPVNMPTNAHGQGYADLNYLIPELVQRINYGKGPYFAKDGDFATAGSAKFQYHDRLDSNFANLTLGSYGYRRALLAGSALLAPQGDSPGTGESSPTLLGAADIMGENGPWTQPEGLHRFNGLLRMSEGAPARGWSLDGIYYDANWRSTDQVPLQLIEPGQLGMFDSLDPSDGGESGRAILSGEWHSEDADGYTKAAAYVQHYRLQLWSNFTFFELRPATGDQFEQAEHRNIAGGDAIKGWKHALFGRDSTAEAGIQIRHDAIHVALLNTQNRIPFAIVSDDDVGLTATGVYVQSTARWASWLRTVAGLREDSIAMNMESLSNPQNSGSARGSKLQPKLSLIFGPWCKTEYFINAGKGFHSNDARGVLDKIDPTTGAPASSVPALVGSTGKEIGLRTGAIPSLQSSLAIWSLNSDSELIYNSDSDIGSTSPNGASKRYGLEWNNQMNPNDWLRLDAALAWTHARYANMNDNGQMGNLIPNAVSKVALIGATAHRAAWSGSVETRYISGYPLTQDGSLTAPSSTVTNVRIGRAWSRDFSVQMDVLNLFNRKYFDIAYAQDYRASPASPIVPSGITVHPGEPLQVRVTAMFKL
jgi:TonB dependent receptor/TonB-dependent Receptor Plug Domain